ncbi:MAG: hypothetical protein GF355_13350 [Candidatus Eisenbacteria bacterium]|nr:hypothetical protein [Candidatus Eisenbacteria bacterium]
MPGSASTGNPVGDWDDVSAIVRVHRPGGGGQETYPLYDDGTHGDLLAGNNYWEAEIPIEAKSTGPHRHRAEFSLTKDGCTVQREAEYSLVVQPDPEVCDTLRCHPPGPARQGENAGLISCVINRCAVEGSFDVEIGDTRGWLLIRQSNAPLTRIRPRSPNREDNSRPLWRRELSSRPILAPSAPPARGNGHHFGNDQPSEEV